MWTVCRPASGALCGETAYLVNNHDESNYINEQLHNIKPKSKKGIQANSDGKALETREGQNFVRLDNRNSWWGEKG